jgi:hypothetical protein
MYSEVYDSAGHSGPAAGDNFWAWAGEARPEEPGGFWSEGDPWIGDPPHEHQGWYSVYDADNTTLDVIKLHAWHMNSLFKPPCEADFEPNGVVDGKDLAEFINRFSAGMVDENDLADLGEDFGRTDCPLELTTWPNS